MTATLSLAPDAAMALGIAATAMPFARTAGDEGERWLRVLRLHGQAGQALQALGVGEGRLAEPGGGERLADPGGGERAGAGQAGAAPGDHEGVAEGPRAGGEPGRRDPVAEVTEEAIRIAEARSAECVQTTDVLLAVMRVYDGAFDRVLEAHGTDRVELTKRLSDQFGVRIA